MAAKNKLKGAAHKVTNTRRSEHRRNRYNRNLQDRINVYLKALKALKRELQSDARDAAINRLELQLKKLQDMRDNTKPKAYGRGTNRCERWQRRPHINYVHDAYGNRLWPIVLRTKRTKAGKEVLVQEVAA